MPTIEIVSINSSGLGLRQEDYGLAIIEENKLESHRDLFSKFLKRQQGVIIHLGNPDMIDNKEFFFFGGKLIPWGEMMPSKKYRFRFLPEYKVDVKRIAKIALDGSPDKRALFLTDYQFGPKRAKTMILDSIEEFWNKHDTIGLRFNTLYDVHGWPLHSKGWTPT